MPIDVKTHTRITNSGKSTVIRQHVRKGDKHINPPKPVVVKKQEETKKPKKPWIPPTTLKQVFTTPPEARELDKQYKENLKKIKEIVKMFPTNAEAKKDKEYIMLKRINKAKMDKYYALVKEYQISKGIGQYGDPSSPEYAGGKEDAKSKKIEEDFYKRFRSELVDVDEKLWKQAEAAVRKLYKDFSFKGFENINEIWSDEFSKINRIIVEFEEKSKPPIIKGSFREKTMKNVRDYNSKGLGRFFFVDRKQERLGYQPAHGYLGDTIVSSVRFDSEAEVNKFLKKWGGNWVDIVGRPQEDPKDYSSLKKLIVSLREDYEIAATNKDKDMMKELETEIKRLIKLAANAKKEDGGKKLKALEVELTWGIVEEEERKLARLKENVNNNKKRIIDIKKDIVAAEQKTRKIESVARNLKAELDKTTERYSKGRSIERELKGKPSKLDKKISALDLKVQIAEQEIKYKKLSESQKATNEKMIAETNKKIAKLEAESNEIDNKIAEFSKKLSTVRKEKESLESKSKAVEGDLVANNEKIYEMNKDISKFNSSINKLGSLIDVQKTNIIDARNNTKGKKPKEVREPVIVRHKIDELKKGMK